MNVVSLFANIGIGEAYLKSLGFDVVVANTKVILKLIPKVIPKE